MTELKIHVYPDPVLNEKCAPIEKVDAATRKLMRDMAEMMYKYPAGGYAASQFGILKRIIVVDDSYGEDPARQFRMANPEITWRSPETIVMSEGCMSIPWGRVELERPERIKFRFLNDQNEIQELEADDYFARCVQHEIDHLDGILAIDRLSKIRRKICLKKFERRRKMGKSIDD
jgi:peptide deformylase